jgi:RNA polymerase sigma factor (sigma-70 family)
MQRSRDHRRPEEQTAGPTLNPARGVHAADESPPSVCADPLTDQQRTYLTLLFNRYRGPLNRYLGGLVRSTEDVAELVQETYFRVMRHTETMKFEAVARSYLFHTATNVAREYYRRRFRRHANQHVDLGEADCVPDEVAPEKHAVLEDALARLKVEVKEMPAELRDILILHRFQHRTHVEIAQLLGVSVRTVERRINRAIDLLTARMRGVL